MAGLTAQQVKNTMLDAFNTDFLTPNQDSLIDTEMLLIETDFDGIAINLPERVSIDNIQQLHMLIASRINGLDEWRYPKKHNVFLLATELATQQVFATRAFQTKKEKENRGIISPQEQLMPDEDEQEEFGAQLSWINLSDLLSGFNRGGKWRVTIIYANKYSNTATLNIVDANAEGTSAKSQSTFTDQCPTKDKWPAYFTPNSATDFSIESHTGIDFLPTYSLKHAGKLNLQGTFSIAETAQFKVSAEHQLRKSSIIAVVPCTLIVVGKNWKKPIQSTFNIPVFTSLQMQSNNLSGYFALDIAFDNTLFEEEPVATSAVESQNEAIHEYTAYLFVDGRCYGPKKVSLRDA